MPLLGPRGELSIPFGHGVWLGPRFYPLVPRAAGETFVCTVFPPLDSLFLPNVLSSLSLVGDRHSPRQHEALGIREERVFTSRNATCNWLYVRDVIISVANTEYLWCIWNALQSQDTYLFIVLFEFFLFFRY